jgi:hypothetical protein
VAGPDTSLLTQPSRAILAALAGGSLGVDDIDLFELNEAFAAVSLPRWPTSVSTPTGSTSTAAPSRWVTRSGRRAIVWR